MTSILLIVVAAYAIIELHGRADDRRRAQVTIAQLTGLSNDVRYQPLMYVRGRPLTSDAVHENGGLRRELRHRATALVRLGRGDLSAKVQDTVSRFNRQVAGLFPLLQERKTDEARAYDNDVIEPSFSGLESLLGQANAFAGREATRANVTSNVGTVLLMTAAAALIGLLTRHRERTRRRAIRVVAERLALQQSEERLRALVQNSSDVIAIVAPDSTVRYLAPSGAGLFGQDPDQVVETKLTQWVHPEDVETVATLLTCPSCRPREFRLRDHSGSWRTCEAKATNLLDDPRVKGMVLNIRDISERKDFEEQLRHQALHDPLTGLPNRVLLLDRLEGTLARARRHQTVPVLLFIDLDHFKTVNDSLGHEAGDRLLQAVAGRLRGALREEDTAVRLGGDEFAVLVECMNSVGDPELVAERLLDMLRPSFSLPGGSVAVTASIGVAVGDRDNPQELLRDADLAMYQAKAAGRNAHAMFHTGMHEAAAERLALRMDLMRGLQERQFRLLYQPVVDTRSGEVVGAEALLRWDHPQRGTVSPDRFIPLAEETGLIVPLGRWVLEEACRRAAAWPGELILSVNVSVKQLESPQLVNDVAYALRRSNLKPQRLLLEITENVLLTDVNDAVARMSALKALGVRIAIDDLGTGYSSLAYLRQLPVDVVKIDRSFVTPAADSEESRALLRALIDVSRALHLHTVAEGVETLEQLNILEEEHCHYAQGYYFSRPLDEQALLKFLSQPATGTGVLSGDPAPSDAARFEPSGRAGPPGNNLRQVAQVL